MSIVLSRTNQRHSRTDQGNVQQFDTVTKHLEILNYLFKAGLFSVELPDPLILVAQRLAEFINLYGSVHNSAMSLCRGHSRFRPPDMNALFSLVPQIDQAVMVVRDDDNDHLVSMSRKSNVPSFDIDSMSTINLRPIRLQPSVETTATYI